MPEAEVNILLRDIKGVLRDPPAGNIIPLSGFPDRRKFVRSGKRYAIFKQTVFKEKPILYVMDILTEEDLDYYTN